MPLPTLSQIRYVADEIAILCEIIVNDEAPGGIGAWVFRALDGAIADFECVELPADVDRESRIEWLKIARDCLFAAEAFAELGLVNLQQEAEEARDALGKFLELTRAPARAALRAMYPYLQRAA